MADIISAPKRGPTRQQHAAMISEEVKMLQRDHPSPSFGEADPNTLRPPGAGQTVDPEAIGENLPPGRMGENDSSTQEGPGAQGAARVVAADEDVPDTTRMARGVRSPHEKVEDPAQGGTPVMPSAAETTTQVETMPTGPAETEEVDEEVVEEEQEEEEEEDVDEQDKTWTSKPGVLGQATAPPISVDVENASRDILLRGRWSPSTLSGSGAESIIEQRVNSIATAGMHEASRDPKYLAQKLMAGHLVRFTSKEERAATEMEAKKIAEAIFNRLTASANAKGKEPPKKPPGHTFAPLRPEVRRRMVMELAAGKDPSRASLSKQDPKRPLLNNISKATLLNGTYSDNDRLRLLHKVRSLLPAGMLGRSAAAQKK
jgi:hypothetical protein